MMQYLHITYTYPPVCFKSSLDYSYYLIQCKRSANSCYTLVFREKENSLSVCSTDGIFSPNSFDP